jgi:hypothetical protein
LSKKENSLPSALADGYLNDNTKMALAQLNIWAKADLYYLTQTSAKADGNE